jgi:hypothetical protein
MRQTNINTTRSVALFSPYSIALFLIADPGHTALPCISLALPSEKTACLSSKVQRADARIVPFPKFP